MQNRGRVVPAAFSGQAPGRFQQRGARVVVEQVDHGIEAHLGHGGVSPPFVDVGSHADREDLAAHDTDNLSGNSHARNTPISCRRPCGSCPSRDGVARLRTGGLGRRPAIPVASSCPSRGLAVAPA